MSARKRGAFIADIPAPEELAEVRRSKGIGIRTMAKDLGMTDDYISRVERGIRMPNVIAAIEICRYLGVTVEDAFGEQATEVSRRRLAAQAKKEP